MKKKELFLWIGFIFLGVSYQTAASDNHFSSQSIADFNARNPLSGVSKSDDYWDLAWHAKMADYGDMISQFTLAQAYEFGKNTDPNPKKSLYFYKKAAQQGHFESCMKLGKIYEENKWVKADPEQSIFWYKMAADRGYVPAMLKISHIYETQKKPNFLESYYWLALATKHMFPHANDLEDKSPALKKMADQLTPEEYEEALIRLEK